MGATAVDKKSTFSGCFQIGAQPLLAAVEVLKSPESQEVGETRAQWPDGGGNGMGLSAVALCLPLESRIDARVNREVQVAQRGGIGEHDLQ